MESAESRCGRCFLRRSDGQRRVTTANPVCARITTRTTTGLVIDLHGNNIEAVTHQPE